MCDCRVTNSFPIPFPESYRFLAHVPRQIGFARTKSARGEGADRFIDHAPPFCRTERCFVRAFRCRVSMHDAPLRSWWDASGSISVTRSPCAFARTAPSLAIKKQFSAPPHERPLAYMSHDKACAARTMPSTYAALIHRRGECIGASLHRCSRLDSRGVRAPSRCVSSASTTGFCSNSRFSLSRKHTSKGISLDLILDEWR